MLDSVYLQLRVHIYTGGINESANVPNGSIIPKSKIKVPKPQFWLIDDTGKKKPAKSQKWSFIPLMAVF